MTTTSTYNWLDLILAVDDDFYEQSNHPLVYLWPEGHERKDAGGGAGIYDR